MYFLKKLYVVQVSQDVCKERYLVTRLQIDSIPRLSRAITKANNCVLPFSYWIRLIRLII